MADPGGNGTPCCDPVYERTGRTVTDRVMYTVEHGISYHERVLVTRSAAIA
ncbi:MAG: hypothetical protein ABIY48_10730 [Acidimicrobiales bacterium]